jgi:hypothetical protein
MRTSLIALTLLACGVAASSVDAQPASPRLCMDWGTPDSAGVLKWDTKWDTVDGREALGALTFTIAANGHLAGSWADASAPSAVWATRARLDGPTLRGAWGAARNMPAGTFLLRRWTVPSRGADGALYCSFDGEYTITGDRTRYKWAGWRRMD